MSLTTNPSLLGQQNLSGTDTALFLKMFAGDVLTTYSKEVKLEALVRNMVITSGKSYQFPALGEAEATYHVRGEDLYDVTKGYLNNIEHGERVIHVDRPCVAPVFVDNWDEMINHYETSAIYSTECAKALARKKDRRLIQLLVKAARDSATLSATQSTTKDGHRIGVASLSTSMSVFKTAILDAMIELTEKDVPMNELVLLVKPAQYFKLMEDGELINLDYGGAGNGSLAMGTIYKAYGFRVVMSNNFPTGIVSANTGELNDYAGDFTETTAVAFHSSAIGTVRRAGLAVEREYSVAKQGNLLVAKFTEGSGILRPECAVELHDTSL